jgi:cytochrome c553
MLGHLQRWSCVVSALALLNAPVLAGGKTAPAAVPGFARFHGEGSDVAEGGRLLFATLNCAQCHASTEKATSSAPVLDDVGARVKRSYLRDFLSDPHKTKPGTTMPDVLAGYNAAEKKELVTALEHFLGSTGTLGQARADRKGVATGHDLYHKVGCVACHGTRDGNGDQEKTFPTSVPLGNLKAKYTIASLKAFLDNPHQTRPNGRMPGLVAGKEASDVANYLLQGTAAPASTTNMTYAYYEGAWKNLPDFDKLKPVTTGEAADFELTIAKRLNDVALKFDGFLKIETEGNYSFNVNSDDGSKLWIDGKVVVNNDGIHPPQTKSGKAKLGKGYHKLTLAVFNAGGGFELSADIEGPGVAKQPLAALVHLSDKPAKADPFVEKGETPLDPELSKKGKALFASLGCANCHELQKETKRLPAADLAKLKPAGGCIDGAAAKGVPHYSLSAAQQTALRAAIKAPGAERSAKDSTVFTMKALNCYSCHERDKIGGVEDDLNKHFQTVMPEMGDEGRLPPPITGVGAKLNKAYLQKIIEQGSHDRPYMHTRMPKFGTTATQLVNTFASIDTPSPAVKVELKEAMTKYKAAARHMVGPQAFGCIKCHTFAGAKAEGVQGMDLAIMTQRLQRDWFHSYMIDPAKYRPGTRMPASFPQGTTLLKNVLDGKADTQIDAIWVYLSDGKGATPPFGLSKTSIPLLPLSEAIIYRNFIQGAGSRAIGVGFPERAHLAFDANDLRLAMIWQGAFIDAKRHWTDRGVGFEPPAGDNVLTLPAGPSFYILGKADEAWPTKASKEVGYKFLGYRLTEDQRPTFLYSFNDIKIEDTPNAVDAKGSPSIRRSFTLTTDNPIDKLYYRAAVGNKIEADKDGWYRVNEYRMRIESAAPPVIRSSAGKMELLVPIQFKGNSAKLVQDYAW